MLTRCRFRAFFATAKMKMTSTINISLALVSLANILSFQSRDQVYAGFR